MEEKSLGILGGMGPMATAEIYAKIVALTKADCDNDHIRVYIDSNAKIPDRTAAILHGGENPVPYMIDSAKKLEQAGAGCIIIPCNTAHYFFDEVSSAVSVPFLHLIKEGARAVPQGSKPALLATSGTVKTGLYSKAMAEYGFEIIVPDEEHQKIAMRAIEDTKAGVTTDRAQFDKLLNHLKERGADSFVLGCTEFPLVFKWLGLDENIIDTTEALARAAIRFCGKEVRE